MAKGKTMNREHVMRLSTHTAQIAHTLLQQIDSDGIIRSFLSDTAAAPDMVASHHLVELLCEMDGTLFSHELQALVSWMVDPKHGFLDDPFALDSFSHVCGLSDDNTKLIREALFESRLQDGSFTKYTAHMRGGDFFSTLWCTKILINYSSEVFSEDIRRALKYLIERQAVAARDSSQRGFLALLLMRTDAQEYEEQIRNIMQGIVNQVKTIDFASVNGLQLMEALYLIEDCARYSSVGGCSQAAEVVNDSVKALFDLSKEADEIPGPISRVQEQCAQSLYYQILSRCCMVGLLSCKASGYDRLHFDVNELVHSAYRRSRYFALAAQSELKKYLEIYGAIHKTFSPYNDHLEAIWEKTPFDRSVFMMMPFKKTAQYRLLTDAIKRECEAQGFHAIRVDDDERRYSERMWDNLIVNMLACKFAVSVYVSDPVVDQLSDGVRHFANPNVALEFGFFCSRGQEIMILKDKKSPLPSDLQGFLWNEFDIENPDQTVGAPLRKWLQRILRDSDKAE
jgi:hypothetical protein